MSTPRRHRWLAWLLPLILLRAFFPVGFMLSWSDQGLQLVLCSGSGPLPDAHARHGHEHHVQAAGAQHQDHSQSHDNAVCPFAAAGTASVAASCVASVAFVTLVADHVPDLAHPRTASTSLLIDRIRGPPAA